MKFFVIATCLLAAAGTTTAQTDVGGGGYDCSKHSSSQSQCNGAKDGGKLVCEYASLTQSCQAKQQQSCAGVFDQETCEKIGCKYSNGQCGDSDGGGEGKGTCTKYDKIDADCKKLSQGQCNIKCSWLQSEGRCGRDPNYDPNSCKDRKDEAKCVPEKEEEQKACQWDKEGKKCGKNLEAGADSSYGAAKCSDITSNATRCNEAKDSSEVQRCLWTIGDGGGGDANCQEINDKGKCDGTKNGDGSKKCAWKKSNTGGLSEEGCSVYDKCSANTAQGACGKDNSCEWQAGANVCITKSDGGGGGGDTGGGGGGTKSCEDMENNKVCAAFGGSTGASDLDSDPQCKWLEWLSQPKCDHTDPEKANDCNTASEQKECPTGKGCAWKQWPRKSCLQYQNCLYKSKDSCNGAKDKGSCHWYKDECYEGKSTTVKKTTSTITSTTTTATTTTLFKCPEYRLAGTDYVQVWQCETVDACIQTTWKCDGSDDCTDGSDEKGCTTTTTTEATTKKGDPPTTEKPSTKAPTQSEACYAKGKCDSEKAARQAEDKEPPVAVTVQCRQCMNEGKSAKELCARKWTEGCERTTPAPARATKKPKPGRTTTPEPTTTKAPAIPCVGDYSCEDVKSFFDAQKATPLVSTHIDCRVCASKTKETKADLCAKFFTKGCVKVATAASMSADDKTKADAFDLFHAIIPATVTDLSVIQGKVLAVVKALPSIRSDQVLFVELKATKVGKFTQVIVYTKKFSGIKIDLEEQKTLTIKFKGAPITLWNTQHFDLKKLDDNNKPKPRDGEDDGSFAAVTTTMSVEVKVKNAKETGTAVRNKVDNLLKAKDYMTAVDRLELTEQIENLKLELASANEAKAAVQQQVDILKGVKDKVCKGVSADDDDAVNPECDEATNELKDAKLGLTQTEVLIGQLTTSQSKAEQFAESSAFSATTTFPPGEDTGSSASSDDSGSGVIIAVVIIVVLIIIGVAAGVGFLLYKQKQAGAAGPAGKAAQVHQNPAYANGGQGKRQNPAYQQGPPPVSQAELVRQGSIC